ncbi:hypothetical protein F2Q65_17575 [Thiohalocapsa marina]|uniref:HIRAN domain-containing protein n=1 Tax=Thiohalocapsa marina TaxID=424902 RepID=A0A5M8FD46_9GAMM|nr:HIRAN domain-containing protein [Thiohalocapsa marina]KAA6182589.1 hypothetical protein F2Q65_17575 [Thiohalocapsa marina]
MPSFTDMPVAVPRQFGVRARLWLRGDWLGAGDSQPRLWLHLVDGRVLAFLLPETAFADDAIISPLLAQVMDDRCGTRLEIDCAGMRALPLYAAPAAPMPQLSWGDPRHAVARAFAAGLDQEVLTLLASLNSHRHWDSLRNYNRIAAREPEQRLHRLQALTRFPLLVAPIVLTAHHVLQHNGGKRHAWRVRDDRVIAAIEEGRDLVGTLARHYDISKGLVRATICRSMWGATALSHRRLLQLLDGIPAHRRPTTPKAFEQAMPLLISLNLLADDDADLRRLGRAAFSQGLAAVCTPLHRHFGPLGPALADCRDFAQAALAWAEAHDERPRGLNAKRLQLAWIEALGFRSLLTASRRWHRWALNQPDAEAEAEDASASSAATDQRVLTPILGAYDDDDAHARELCDAVALQREGAAMHHCVANYWDDCWREGTRIFALQLRRERATAEYAFSLDTVTFSLAQLRGPCNAACSDAMSAFAEAVQEALNAPECALARGALALDLFRQPPEPPTNRSAPIGLDPASQRDLARVLAPLRETPASAWGLLQGFVAGYQHHVGPAVEPNMQVGDALELIREPENPHDPLAIAIAWRGERIGYLPRRLNVGIAERLDAGRALRCRIARLDEQAAAWGRVQFIVLDEVIGED